jgi:hypothetical protein
MMLNGDPVPGERCGPLRRVVQGVQVAHNEIRLRAIEVNDLSNHVIELQKGDGVFKVTIVGAQVERAAARQRRRVFQIAPDSQHDAPHF